MSSPIKVASSENNTNTHIEKARNASAPKSAILDEKSPTSREILLQHIKGIGNTNQARSSKTPSPMLKQGEYGVFNIDLRKKSIEPLTPKGAEEENNEGKDNHEKNWNLLTELQNPNREGFFTFRGDQDIQSSKEDLKKEGVLVISIEDEINKESIVELRKEIMKENKAEEVKVESHTSAIDFVRGNLKKDTLPKETPNKLSEPISIFEEKQPKFIEKAEPPLPTLYSSNISPKTKEKPILEIQKPILNLEKSIDLSIVTQERNRSSSSHIQSAAMASQLKPASQRSVTPQQEFHPPSVLTFDEFMSQCDPNRSSFASNSPLTNSFIGQSPKDFNPPAPQRPVKKYEIFKKQAQEKEKLMIKRKKSIIKIQAHIRGWLCRLRVKRIKDRYRETQRLLRIRDVCERIKISWAPYIILKALQRWVEIRRKEKLEVYNMFVEYSAVFIQKFFRGYLTRKKWWTIIEARINAKSVILSLVRAWKTRKILKTKEMRNIEIGIKDMTKLASEFSSEGNPNTLLSKVHQQIPALKRKYIQEFRKIYNQGSWVYLPPLSKIHTPYDPSTPKNDKQGPIVKTESFRLSLERSNSSSSPQYPKENYDFDTDIYIQKDKEIYSSHYSREDQPIKPLQVTYNQIAEQGEDAIESMTETKPVKKFSNFLKRGEKKKYDPLKKAKENKNRKSIEAKKEEEKVEEKPIEEKVEEKPIEEKTIEAPKVNEKRTRGRKKSPEAPIKGLDNEEIEKKIEEDVNNVEDPEDTKRNTTPHSYLKRKSQTYKPATKVEWKVQKRIDCWGSPNVNEHIEKKKKPIVPSIQLEKQGIPIEDLESIFSGIARNHINPNYFFKNREVKDTIIPQFNENSYFITHYSDDIYQDTLKVLDDHYQYLCNEDESVLDRSLNNNY
ncbi:unnamed protein product [Blepharisma stoltei]|uniref:Uncharacterized protein n=1 Tax=Blepharisma stoltei TaxID=1481888 RepID=A0AAU9J7D8_9CILI|nr:unnamed protein product [Blepharisma stoltei]